MGQEHYGLGLIMMRGQYDVLLMDYREGKTWFPVTCDIINSGELVVRDK